MFFSHRDTAQDFIRPIISSKVLSVRSMTLFRSVSVHRSGLERVSRRALYTQQLLHRRRVFRGLFDKHKIRCYCGFFATFRRTMSAVTLPRAAARDFPSVDQAKL
jgi:hypothetical protein